MKNRAHKTILLVEDDAVALLVGRDLFKSFGYAVVTAKSGEEAVQLATRNDKIALVLMDINPGAGMDGAEAARQILGKRNLPVVFLTSHSEKEYVERIKAITRYGYILKNSDKFVIRTSIEMALELFASGEALRESEQKYRTLFREMLDGFALHEIICDEQGNPADYRFIVVNPAFEFLTGLKAEDIVGRTVLEVLPGIERDLIKTYGKVALTGESVFFEMYSAELKKHYEVKAFRPIPNHFACIFADITARKRAEEAKVKFEAQNRQLQKAESLGRMAGAIAHQFNNQLQSVIGNLELAMKEFPRGEDPAANLTAAIQASHKAAEVSRLMLTYLGQTSVQREQIDLSDACRSALPMLQAAMPKSVVLEADVPSPGPAISANADQMLQIMTNLVTNAWEAVGEGPGAIHLTVKTVSAGDIIAEHRRPIDWQMQDQGYACLEVADTGCGIARNDIEKLFDPFFSTKFIGRGLGLPAVLGIVRSYEGCITIESKPGRGSVFRVLLPVSAAKITRRKDLSAVPGKAQAGKAAPAREFEAGGTVLLVEDEQTVRKLTATVLARMGFTVLEAKDGVEAIEIFRQHKDEVRCAICDLSMPRMNGWETIAALRALRPDLPVILASGYDAASVMAGDHPEQPQAFLGKPYTHKELGDALGRALESAGGVAREN